MLRLREGLISLKIQKSIKSISNPKGWSVQASLSEMQCARANITREKKKERNKERVRERESFVCVITHLNTFVFIK